MGRKVAGSNLGADQEHFFCEISVEDYLPSFLLINHCIHAIFNMCEMFKNLLFTALHVRDVICTQINKRCTRVVPKLKKRAGESGRVLEGDS